MNPDSEQERTKETEIETGKYAKYAERRQKNLNGIHRRKQSEDRD